MDDSVQLKTAAWLFRGASALPGRLSLSAGRLSFVAVSGGTAFKWQLEKLERAVGNPGMADRIRAGEAVAVFDIAVNSVEVDFPWYYLASGLRVRLERAPIRFSFMAPNNQLPIDTSNALGAVARGKDELTGIWRAVRCRNAWKAALGRARNP